MTQGLPPFRVLSLDGGGMRGTYTATYLDKVAATFGRRRNIDALDIGAAFDLIVGTSTGGIIAAALATGVPLADIVALYVEHGPSIFSRPLPTGAISALIFVTRQS
jgi:patatin-like phospholipase/acyl hydrolase